MLYVLIYTFYVSLTQAVVNVIADQTASPLPDTNEVAETMREDIEARLHQTDTTVESTRQVCYIETLHTIKFLNFWTRENFAINYQKFK